MTKGGVPTVCVLVIAGSLVALSGRDRVESQPAGTHLDWPAVSEETRPWTRWWWLGSALDNATITRELEALRAAGFGGVELTPIYGARGHERQFVPYLSDNWIRLLEHTLREARRLGLGVDVATGTGWPFGGPWVTEADSARTLVFKTWEIDGGGRLDEPVRAHQEPLVRALGNQVYEVGETPPAVTTQAQPLLRADARPLQIADLVEPIAANANLQALALEQVTFPKDLPVLALMAYGGGQVIDLTARIDADRRLSWSAPPGHWTIYGVFLGWHGKLVERAAPGGEGWVIDHFSRDAIRHYLARFDRALTNDASGIRAFFNDSYEVDDATGQADGTPAIFEAFSDRLGYDLRRAASGVAATGSGRRQRPRACRLPSGAFRFAARVVHNRVGRVGASSRRPDPQPGAWVASQPARPLRGERHPRNRGHRDRAEQVGGVCWSCRRSPVDRGRSGHLARRTLPFDAGRHPRDAGSVLRRGRQPHRLSRHRRVAGKCTVAGVAVLRSGRVQRSQSVVARSAGAQSVRDARPVVHAVRRAGSRCAPLLPVL